MSEKQDTGGSVWFTSPVVAAASAALFGLLGTGFGVSLQGYWTQKLERQKFESSMIQQALESADGEEAKRKLQFLIKSGIVTTLNTQAITDLANNPKELPLLPPTGFRDLLGQLLPPERQQDETASGVKHQWPSC